MTHSRIKIIVAALVLGTLACGGVKAPAEQAISAADTALGTVAAEASKYVPAEFKSAQDVLAGAKASFEKGDYQTALVSAQEIPGQVSALRTAIEAKKAELTKAWDAMGGLPKVLDGIKARVGVLTQAKRLPAGLSAATLAEAKNGLTTLSQGWADASTAAQSGDLVAAVAKATAVKDEAGKIMTSLKMELPAGIY